MRIHTPPSVRIKAPACITPSAWWRYVRKGDRVLVLGGGGGVGCHVLQLLWLGPRETLKPQRFRRPSP